MEHPKNPERPERLRPNKKKNNGIALKGSNDTARPLSKMQTLLDLIRLVGALYYSLYIEECCDEAKSSTTWTQEKKLWGSSLGSIDYKSEPFKNEYDNF